MLLLTDLLASAAEILRQYGDMPVTIVIEQPDGSSYILSHPDETWAGLIEVPMDKDGAMSELMFTVGHTKVKTPPKKPKLRSVN